MYNRKHELSVNGRMPGSHCLSPSATARWWSRSWRGGDETGASLLGIPPDEEDRVMEEAAEFTPACVAAIDAYWREKRPRQISMPLTASPPSQPVQTSRNRPQRPVLLRLRQKVQKVLRQRRLSTSIRRPWSSPDGYNFLPRAHRVLRCRHRRAELPSQPTNLALEMSVLPLARPLFEVKITNRAKKYVQEPIIRSTCKGIEVVPNLKAR